ncbi:hypothetical protein PHYSODRAFT_327648 [Phytophthora sojae]|uniref:RxLR effector protein n=1 Tax=Phytophthora sojae (strain P6497) TaxID=1094619 RepID=G4Z3K7_PHYSP|nr:hypothetical protein PHYSODRAFT_327648 [Phytophthora sojae]EGZ19379.1 hypothetical protein PHYSODRAFT_327648 [Phytophthora sojae]|eukprot:XP_009522096.1 hypothetical protein PHYSODRAFT_327648 [Phytophthora sojae]
MQKTPFLVAFVLVITGSAIFAAGQPGGQGTKEENQVLKAFNETDFYVYEANH